MSKEIKRQLVTDDQCEKCGSDDICAITQWTDEQGRIYQSVQCTRCEDKSKKTNLLVN